MATSLNLSPHAEMDSAKVVTAMRRLGPASYDCTSLSRFWGIISSGPGTEPAGNDRIAFSTISSDTC